MKHLFSQLSLQQSRFFLKLALIGNIILASVLVLLALKVFTQETQIVLVPQYDVGKRVTLSRSEVSPGYLRDWSEGVLESLLNVSAETVDSRMQKVWAFVHPEHIPEMRKVWEPEVARIKRSNASLAFYPKTFDVDQAKRQIKVTGVLHAWFATDSKPIVKSMIYTVGYVQHPSGLVLLRSVSKEEHA